MSNYFIDMNLLLCYDELCVKFAALMADSLVVEQMPTKGMALSLTRSVGFPTGSGYSVGNTTSFAQLLWYNTVVDAG